MCPQEVRKLSLDIFENYYLTLHNTKQKEYANKISRSTQETGVKPLEGNQTNNGEKYDPGAIGRASNGRCGVEPWSYAENLRQTDKGLWPERPVGDIGSRAGNITDEDTPAIREGRKSRADLTEEQKKAVD